MTRDTDVLIAGAGPTGLTLATQLCRLGVGCIIVDKNAVPSATSRAIGLQYRVSELLSWMGLLDRFAARASTGMAVNLMVDGRAVARLVMGELRDRAGKGAFRPRPLILPQSDTEALLAGALEEQGGIVERGKTLVGFTDDGSGVTARIAPDEEIRARFLVSCEGAHGVTRKQLGIPFEGKTFPHDFVMADVALAGRLVPGESYTWLHPDGMFTAIAMPGKDRWRLFIEAGATPLEEVTLEAVQAMFAARTGDRTSRLADPAPTWLTRFQIHSRMVARFRAGRVFLAGDAAHLHSPSGGQGITTGMQDAFNLAWKLAQVLRHGGPVSLLDSYEAERKPAARAVLETTDRNTGLLLARTPVARWIRDHVVMPLLGTRVVQRRLLTKLSQLRAHYRGSPLSRGGCAGDRAPDVQLLEDGTLTSLHAQLAAGRFVGWVRAAGSGRSQAWAQATAAALRRLGIRAAVVGDVYGDLARLYRLRGEGLVLIRPDGHVGFVCRPIREAALRRYLALLWPADAIARAFAPIYGAVGGEGAITRSAVDPA